MKARIFRLLLPLKTQMSFHSANHESSHEYFKGINKDTYENKANMFSSRRSVNQTDSQKMVITKLITEGLFGRGVFMLW